MQRKWFQNILSGGLIALLIFAFFEILVRVLVSNYPFYDVEMWRYGTFLKERAPDSRMSHQHVPSRSANLYRVEVSINSKRLRDREFDYERNLNVRRILFLGDSLTFGWGVRFKDVFAKRLEPLLSVVLDKTVEVINTGIGNYNTEQEWTFYKTEGYKYNSDEVMLLYFINDAELTPKYSEVTFKENSMLIVFLWSRIKKILVKLGGSKNFLDYYKNLYANDAEGWKVSRKSLLAIRDAIHKENGRFLVAICPELRSFRLKYPFQTIHDRIINFLKANNIKYVDLLPLFRKKVFNEENIWVSSEDSHPNALGHKIIAEGISEYYRKQLSKSGKFS